jgi:hypothetical protein
MTARALILPRTGLHLLQLLPLLVLAWLMLVTPARAGCEELCEYDRRQTFLMDVDEWRGCLAGGMDPCPNWRNRGGFSVNTGGVGSMQMGELVKPFSIPPMSSVSPVLPGIGDNMLDLSGLLSQLGGLSGAGAFAGMPGGLGGIFTNLAGGGFTFNGPDLSGMLNDLRSRFPEFDLGNIPDIGFDLRDLVVDPAELEELFPDIEIPKIPIVNADGKLVDCEIVKKIKLIPEPIYELCRHHVDMTDLDFEIIR